MIWLERFPDQVFSWIKKSPKLRDYLIEHGIGAGPHNFFFRLWWEIPLQKESNTEWPGLVNGGVYAPYYREDSLCIDWRKKGRLIKEHLNKIYPYLKGNVGLKIQREQIYFKSGITYGKRSERFNAQILHEGMIPSFNGIGLYTNSSDLWWILAYLNSRFVGYYLNLTCGLHKNPIYVDRLPVPDLTEREKRIIGENARYIYEKIKHLHNVEETSHSFEFPIALTFKANNLNDSLYNWLKEQRAIEISLWERVIENESIINNRIPGYNNIENEIREDQGILPSFDGKNSHKFEDKKTKFEIRPIYISDLYKNSSELFNFIVNNRIEIKQAKKILDQTKDLTTKDKYDIASSLISYLVGVIFGRWDLDYCNVKNSQSEGIENGNNIFKFSKSILLSDVKKKNQSSLFEFNLNGIVSLDVDSENNIITNIRNLLLYFWPNKSNEIEQELCEFLNFSSLYDYFISKDGFFKNHINQYSKNRRKAPIYWILSTKSNLYSLLIYYNRLNDQTLYKCVNDFIEPKLNKTSKILEFETKNFNDTSNSQKRKEIENLNNLLYELLEFKNELLQLISLRYNPNQNDGVEITAAPLWKLINFTSWQSDLKKCWEDIKTGLYDWSYMANSLWPDRIKVKCRTDKFLAISHNLEELYEELKTKLKKN